MKPLEGMMTDRLEREEDLDRVDLTGQRQPFPVGDNYGQAVQAIRPLPVDIVSDVVPFDGIVTIANGGTLSSGLITNYARIVNIDMPVMTSCKLSFQFQARPGANWKDMFDELGQELQLPASTHNVGYPVPGLSGVYAIKVRSGLTGATTAQGNTRNIHVFGTV